MADKVMVKMLVGAFFGNTLQRVIVLPAEAFNLKRLAFSNVFRVDAANAAPLIVDLHGNALRLLFIF